MHVRFIAPFDYTPSRARRTTIAYKANPDLVVTVKRECGEEAVRLGRAVEVTAEADQPEASSNDGAPTV